MRPGGPGESGNARGRASDEITKGIAQLYREHYGKGPIKAKTVVLEDTVLCELEDFFTPVEKTLIERGEVPVVRDVRLRFQDALRPEFTRLIESSTGRVVRAFLSQCDIDAGVAVEVFLLEPKHPGEVEPER
jgi:uncharacterized protein YbcI